jgi:hypothetical protein
MGETQSARTPQRDADGRLATSRDLIAVSLAGLAAGVVILLIFEGVMTLIQGPEKFGDASGWIAIVLPVWIFTEEFRAARFGAYRVIVCALAAGFGAAAGLTLAGLVAPVFPPLVSGAIGAFGLIVVYCLVWFYGLRWLDHRRG